MKYTVDRIEDGMYILLKKDDEIEELLISVDKYAGQLLEGDIVQIRFEQEEPIIEKLKEETEAKRKKVADLLEKLQNKNKK